MSEPAVRLADGGPGWESPLRPLGFAATGFAWLAWPKLTLRRSLACAKAGAPGRIRTRGLGSGDSETLRQLVPRKDRLTRLRRSSVDECALGRRWYALVKLQMCCVPWPAPGAEPYATGCAQYATEISSRPLHGTCTPVS